MNGSKCRVSGSRYAEAPPAFPDATLAENIFNQPIEAAPIAAIEEDAADAEELAHRAIVIGEHFSAAIHVEIEELAGSKSGAEAEGDDAARGGAGDKVEAIRDQSPPR